MPRKLPRIAVDLRALVPPPTGIGVYTRSLLTALARLESADYRGWAHRPIRQPEELERLGVELATQQSPLGLLWQQLRLPPRLRKDGIDLFWSPLMTLPMWRTSVPTVVTVHDLTVLTHPETHRLKVRASLLPFLRRSIERATAIVAISQATAGDLRRFFPGNEHRTHVVYNGVAPDFSPGLPEEIQEIRHQRGAPEGYLLYVGTLEPRKNVDRILDAWESLRAQRLEFPPLVIAGAPGWRNSALRQRLENLAGQGVEVLGHLGRSELIRLYQGARIFLYPSLYEGFGLPPLEAMACGIPVIVSNVSSLPEVVGEAGLQVSPQDPEALAGAIAALLDEAPLAARLAADGLRRARRFSWDRSAREMEAVFFEILGRR